MVNIATSGDFGAWYMFTRKVEYLFGLDIDEQPFREALAGALSTEVARRIRDHGNAAEILRADVNRIKWFAVTQRCGECVCCAMRRSQCRNLRGL